MISEIFLKIKNIIKRRRKIKIKKDRWGSEPTPQWSEAWNGRCPHTPIVFHAYKYRGGWLELFTPLTPQVLVQENSPSA
jgi:hypothetical protein